MFNLNFSIVIFSETWVDDNKLVNDSLSQLSGYNISHQLRKNQRGEKKYICTWVTVHQKETGFGNWQHRYFE